jgi:exopolyphosphatase/guanosine-5'-triphosphate,3'-diphosphate pyrophosphatase
MKVAAVDIGTNSIRLLVTDGDGKELAREMNITRLGQDVDRTGRLSDAAIERSLRVLEDYGAIIRRLGAERVRATATSAARDADNRAQFFHAAERALGVLPECIPGEEEARLSFRGATFGLAGRDGPFLVVDIGGGSTEFILGTRAPEQLISVDMGCVRMTERHLHDDPPSAEQLEACCADIRRTLVAVREAVDVARARCVIGLAGTVTALAYLKLGLKRYDPARSHHMRLSRADVERMFAELSRMSERERREVLAEPKRSGVIVAGSAVLATILREFAIDALIVSETDILDGLAASLREATGTGRS